MRHAVGDSHVRSTFRDTDVVPHWLGPVTMHGIGTRGLVLDFPLAAGDTLFFTAGEIDVRCHIHRQVQAGRELPEIVGTLVANYLAVLGTLRQDGVRFVVVSVTPPASSEALGNPDYPFVGEDADRACYTQALNRELEERSGRHGLDFLDLYPLYADEAGMLVEALSDGSVHIGDTAGVQRLLGQL